jgi:hypothetical protein
MLAELLDLLTWLNVTIAWAASEMRYAAIWFPDDCLMVLDATRSHCDLRCAIDELMPDVRLRALPSHPPPSWRRAA